MQENKKHTNVGIASIILGIVGLSMFFSTGLWFCISPINWFGVILNILWGFVSLFLGISSVITGIKAKKQGDAYGKYGLILGIIATALGLVIIIVVIKWDYTILSMWVA